MELQEQLEQEIEQHNQLAQQIEDAKALLLKRRGRIELLQEQIDAVVDEPEQQDEAEPEPNE